MGAYLKNILYRPFTSLFSQIFVILWADSKKFILTAHLPMRSFSGKEPFQRPQHLPLIDSEQKSPLIELTGFL